MATARGGLALLGQCDDGGESSVPYLPFLELECVRVEVAMLETSDGHGRLERMKFHAPSARVGDQHAPANTLGIRRIASS
jgi:hypothetical protein